MPKQTAHIPEHLAGTPQPLNPAPGVRARRRFGFLLVPGFTYIGFASAIEPLRLANMVAGTQHFEALTLTTNGHAVAASNGVRTLPDAEIDATSNLDALFVCGPNPIVFPQEKRLRFWLRHLAGQGTALGGIDTGSYLLARAGLLDGYCCTIHWQDMQHLLEHFPEVVVSSHLFEIDRDRYTSTGGTASMDMMLTLIAREPGGAEMAAAASTLLIQDRMRNPQDSQRIPLRQRVGTAQPKLSDAATLMEANIEEPLTLCELARQTGLSSRQLERLFRERLHCTPSDYYMQLRLSHARELLLHTEQAIAEVGWACGFASASHFSKRYARFFGHTPSHERRSRPSGAAAQES